MTETDFGTWSAPRPIPSEKANVSDNPLVSIIVPVYNSEKTIGRLLGALVEQTYENIEIILIDDGSTDGGADLCRTAAENDSRIILIQQENAGVSAARNAGLKVASGEWIYFSDADDWMVADSIETFVRTVLSTGCDLAITEFYRVSKGVIGHKHGPATGVFSTEQFLRYMARRPADHYYGSLWNKMFRRSIIEKERLRFDTGIKFGEDHVFILNFLRSTEVVTLIDRPMYYYIDTEGSLIHSGFNAFGVVKMKWDTYRPYLRLYNDFNLYHGLRGRLRIYKFMFIPALDHFVDRGDEPFDPRAFFEKFNFSFDPKAVMERIADAPTPKEMVEKIADSSTVHEIRERIDEAPHAKDLIEKAKEKLPSREDDDAPRS